MGGRSSPLTDTVSNGVTLIAGEETNTPLIRTTPMSINFSASLLEQIPLRAIRFAILMVASLMIGDDMVKENGIIFREKEEESTINGNRGIFGIMDETPNYSIYFLIYLSYTWSFRKDI